MSRFKLAAPDNGGRSVGPSGEPTVALVMPAQDAAADLEIVVPAALAAMAGADMIVVDAGSRDETAARAAALGARVVMLPDRAGPSAARNAGVAAVDADVVLFLDADCIPRPNVVARVRDAFAGDPQLVSLTGSYAAETPQSGFVSQYMNLRHHFTHQTAQREPATFWTGCGAVRRRAFLSVGGFDVEGFPNGMEDMELGLRLAECGTTRLDPELQVTHLKHWTMRGVVDAEIYRRAVPWARLILERGHFPDDLNTRISQRLAALVSPFALVAMVTLPQTVAVGAWPIVAAALAALLASVLLNVPMLRVIAHQNGIRFAVVGWLFHQVHLVYSAATLLVCVLIYQWQRIVSPRRSASSHRGARPR